MHFLPPATNLHTSTCKHKGRPTMSVHIQNVPPVYRQKCSATNQISDTKKVALLQCYQHALGSGRIGVRHFRQQRTAQPREPRVKGNA